MGPNWVARGSAERIWGELFSSAWLILGNCRRISQRILVAPFFLQNFRPWFQNPPPPPKFTPEIHTQTCRCSSPMSRSRTQHFFHSDFLLTVKTNNWVGPWVLWWKTASLNKKRGKSVPDTTGLEKRISLHISTAVQGAERFRKAKIPLPIRTLGLHSSFDFQGIMSRFYAILGYIKELWSDYFL